MAFGITRMELIEWKEKVQKGDIAFLTHYWRDSRFKGCHTVTKVGSSNINKLKKWGKQYGLKEEWIDYHIKYPHFDLFGETQHRILLAENLNHHIERFNL